MTAGHNALRGSGPGQNPAFNDALTHVGCPDRRIDGAVLSGDYSPRALLRTELAPLVV